MGAAALEDRNRTFAANRAIGRIALAVEARAGSTRRARVAEAGSLRVRFPGPPAEELEAVILNTAGGIAGGDAFEIEVAAGRGSRLIVTSAAAEKVYRSLGPDARVDVRLKVAAGASLAWLPQETILFDRARLCRKLDVDLADDARLVLAEAVVFGRTGMGETVEQGLLLDRWRVRRAGRLLHAETARLSGAVARRLGETAVANGGAAVASVLIVPAEEATVAAVRAYASFRGEVGISAWNGLAAGRLVAADGAALRHDLAAVLSALRGGRLPRLWLH